MRRTPPPAEMEFILNVSFKRNAICQNYMQYDTEGDIQGYLIEQLETNPQLLSWIFDNPSLYGKSHLALDCGQYEAFQDFYNSLSIYDD